MCLCINQIKIIQINIKIISINQKNSINILMISITITKNRNLLMKITQILTNSVNFKKLMNTKILILKKQTIIMIDSNNNLNFLNHSNNNSKLANNFHHNLINRKENFISISKSDIENSVKIMRVRKLDN